MIIINTKVELVEIPLPFIVKTWHYTLFCTCQIQISAQAGGALQEVHPAIIAGTADAMRVATGGLGGAFVWPALRRLMDRRSPGYAA